MAFPSITRTQAREAVSYVSAALADGFAAAGIACAINEGHRRFCAATGSTLSHMTFRHRIRRAEELYGMKPTKRKSRTAAKPKPSEKARAKAAKAAVDIEALSAQLRASLKPGPKLLPELS